MFSRSIYKYRVHTMALGLYRKETRVEIWRYQKKRLQLNSQTDWYLPSSLIENQTNNGIFKHTCNRDKHDKRDLTYVI